MRKIFLVLVLAVISLNTYSQSGDFAVGAKAGYITYYKNLLYGLDLSYHLTDPLELAFTGLYNSDVSLKNEITNKTNKFAIYSMNLDARLYLIMQESWATGPVLGGQYLISKCKTDDLISEKVFGFNMGWHIRANVTDNLKINGGWRYTNAKEELSHNLFYAGVAFTF
jgi:opacity protein-like surface antigen